MAKHVFDLILRLYPRAFRERFGSEIRSVLAEDLRRARAAGLRAVLRFWLEAVRDTVEASVRMRLGRGGRVEASVDAVRGAATGMGGGVMEGLGADVRFAARSFRRQPGFHALAVLTVALGVAATTSVFSVLDGVVRRPLPYPEAHRLVQVSLVMQHGIEGRDEISHPDVVRIAEANRTLEQVAAVETRTRVVTGEGDPRTVNVALADANLFGLLGARPAVGRMFAPQEHGPGAGSVVLLPYATWAGRYGRDPSVVGRRIELDGRAHEIVGVLARDFVAPEAVTSRPDYWLPLHLDRDAHGFFGASAIARLRNGVSIPAADADINGIITRAYEELGVSFIAGARVRDLRTATIGDVGSTLWLMMGAVGLLLVIGCLNVANLMLVRATDRGGEVALRTAMGATRRRIARQLVTESVTIGLAGGAIGALFAHGLISAFLAWGPGGIPRLEEVALDARALIFAFGVSALTGIMFGLIPALRSAHVAPVRALVSGRHSASLPVGRLRSGLVVAETAIALVLVLAAGLLVNSFVRMRTVNPGFDPEGLVTARLELRAQYADDASRLQFWNRVLEATQAIPGVEHAAITAFVPFVNFAGVQTLTPEGWAIPPNESVVIVAAPITRDFVETLGVDMVQGRNFDGTERENGEAVVLVSEAFARTYWPGESGVIGKRIKSGSMSAEDDIWYTVVGVVADAHHRFSEAPIPIVYRPMVQAPWPHLSIIARTAGPEGVALEALRNAIRSVDPGLPLRNFGTLESLASASVAQPRFYSTFAAGFGTLALLLALVGIYGTAAYATARRAREIGIRIALGAEKRSVLSMLTFDAARLALLGIALGVPAALATMRLLEGHLFGIEPTDPSTFLVVSIAVATTASLAAWLPARRAAGTDPMTTLRSDA